MFLEETTKAKWAGMIAELPTALLRWYPFRHGSRVLCLDEDGSMADMLRQVFQMDVVTAGLEQISSIEGKFDYVVAISTLEQAIDPVEVLVGLRQLLVEDGVLLLAMNNRLGMRYFCGDRDLYTNKIFDGIEDYRQGQSSWGRMYARGEIESMLDTAGWSRRKFYSVLPNLEEPVFLFADGQLPKEDLANRLFPSYHNPRSVFLQEESLYRTLADNGLFHAMANAYLIECSPKADFADALYVTSSLERGKDNAMMTVIHADGTVSKEAAYPKGMARLRRLAQHMKKLQEQGVPVVEGHLDADGRYIMPYIDSVTGQVYLKDLLQRDKEAFLQAMDAFREAILASSPIHWGEFTDAKGNTGETELFDEAFLDMVPLNSFYLDGQFVFFDQEFSAENYPVNVVLTRMIATFYAGNSELEKILSKDDLYARYGLLEEKQRWLEMEWAFLRELLQKEPLADYHRLVRRDNGLVAANRSYMNCLGRDYRRLFFDIFQDADSKKIILFGSGRYAREYMDLYRVRYPVYAIVDNNEAAWGTEIHGVKVQSPVLLENMDSGEYKVLVCIKNFLPVMEQLESMQIDDYSIFDPGKSYAIPRTPITDNVKPDAAEEKKKYHVGYVAGVFDLFHIGHLNLLRRAKEQCDYLIVGVVSDRQVREGKKVEPFVPFEERLEMVRACRYVDEAHEIPFEHPDTNMAWKLYHFDVQFSGSDYEHDPVWLRKKEWLEERGSTMVFFPYTQSTSSTKLKKLITERLI
ncbi:adenylyltransferase/cytidyltransferase family protein [Selenomonas sp. ND2010]|uniref:adenylyltransferase/cytidyltransferase family protein n=1 Tax=Selenomonas sp. ND2010 TaxID=1410618 RepID=UPI000B1C4C40|nr:adenylyltransferase/cytidyltransferase family protein [Selenomonas sp. ND2010]